MLPPHRPDGFTLVELFVVVGVIAATINAQAATVTIGALKDATIFQNNVNNSSGAGNGLYAGTNSSTSIRRALLAFDVASALPAGATVQEVQLKLTLAAYASTGQPPNRTIQLHRLQGDWGEGTTQQQVPPTDDLGGQGQGAPANSGDATWTARFYSESSSTSWTAPGGDFAPTASASIVVSNVLNVAYQWPSTAAIVSNVQGWLDQPTTNFGWLLKNSDEIAGATYRSFYSSDAATAAYHPQLTIVYATAAASPADFNSDGDVDGDDFAAWRLGFGNVGAADHDDGDADGDHDVDGADFLIWQRELRSEMPAEPASRSVPEPSVLMLACAAVVGWNVLTQRYKQAARPQRHEMPDSFGDLRRSG